jgi:hypothetical protein
MLEKPARTKTLAYYEHSSITYVRKNSHNIGPLVLYYPDNPYLFVKKLSPLSQTIIFILVYYILTSKAKRLPKWKALKVDRLSTRLDKVYQ